MKRYRSMPPLRALVLFLLSVMPVAGQEPKPALKYWKEADAPAEVLAATFLGGPGTEWLVSGGFQSDGSIVLVGNVLGPNFRLSVAETVIGTDLPKPSDPRPVPVLDRGQPKKDADGNPVWERPSWRHEGATGFIVHCSADLKEVRSVQRMPWGSGAITSAVIGKDGAILIAGRASDGITNLGGDCAELEVAADAERKSGGCNHIFLAHLNSDGRKAEWVRHAKGFSDAPRLSLLEDGRARLSAQQVWDLGPDGKVARTIIVPGGTRRTTSISPKDGRIVIGGEHHWPTGREPWRCPTLTIHQPNGKLQYQLYDWGGPYVGLDNSRLVSDSAIRLVSHDRQGNLLLYAWSDGGNSVMTCQPADVRQGVGLRGLDITAAGAGVLSAAYLIRVEPREFRATAWTIWLAFGPKGKPNSVWVDTFGEAEDGSIALAGRSAWGLWQTRNTLSEAEPSGEYIALLDKDLTGVRFCSVVPGAGAAEVDDGSQRLGSSWGIISGQVDGKPRLLFVGSAARKDGADPVPTKNALQVEFGGGASDGYAVLLDLSATAPGKPRVEPASTLAGPTSASFERGARGRNPKYPSPVPAEGSVFHFAPGYPKHVTVDAEFRDRGGKLWPSFLYGKPVEGSLTIHEQDLEGRIVVGCPSICQPAGDQERRVLGELVKGPKDMPPLMLMLESLGMVRSAEIAYLDKGKEAKRTVEYRDGKGTLDLAGRKIAVQPKVTWSFAGPKDGGAETVHLTAWLTVKGNDLGLMAADAQGEIDVRISMSGTIRDKGK